MARLKDPYYFVQGYVRYWLYKWGYLPKYQVEQYQWRLTKTNPKCLEDGKCVHCGCTVPKLQMASKGCTKGCYPPWFSKEQWAWWKEHILKQVLIQNPSLQKQNWIEIEKNLGEVSGSRSFYFYFTAPHKITRVESGCSKCTKTEIGENQAGKFIKVTYTPLDSEKGKHVVKPIKVYYQTAYGEFIDLLKFEADPI